MSALSAASPFPARLRAYLGERFPVGSYLLLTALYVGGGFGATNAAGLARAGGGGRLPIAVVVVLLGFFHLRLCDELKDDAADRVNHPERLVQRGIVRLGELRLLLAAAVALEIALSASLGLVPAAIWGGMLVGSALMRVELFVGHRLAGRPLTYAVTHQPIMLVVTAFVHAAAGAPAGGLAAPALLLHQAVGLGGMFAFEIARKLRAPADELPQEITYTTAHGPAGAAAIALGLLGLATAAAVALLGAPALALLACAIPFLLFARRPSRTAARRANGAATIFLVSVHGALALVLWGLR